MSQLILLLSVSLVVCNLLLFSMCIYIIFFCAPTLVQFMNAFDRAMNLLDEKYSFLASTKQIVSSTNEEDKVIVFERGDLVFVFNFHPEKTYDGYKVGCDLPGKYRVALDSDALEFGGHGRVGHDADHFTSPEGIPGVPETNFNNRPNSFKVLSPARTCVVYYRVEESEESHDDDDEMGLNEILAADVIPEQEDVEEAASQAKVGKPHLVDGDGDGDGSGLGKTVNFEVEDFGDDASDD